MFGFFKRKKSKQGTDEDFDASDRRLEELLEEFKAKNRSKGVHHAASTVRDFMVWQHNFAMIDKIEALDEDDARDDQEQQAEEIERAFLIGAAGVAADYFSIPPAQENLFLLNILGTYKGLGPGLADRELELMFEASGAQQKATSLGGSVMMHFLAYGKQDEFKIHLAALQRRIWA